MTDAPAPAAAEPAHPGPAAARPGGPRPGRRWLAGLAWAGAALLVFAVYLRMQQRRALRAQWFDAALLTAGVIAAAAAAAALRLIGAAAHHLRYGLGNSALGSVVTVSSGGRVALRPLAVTGHQLGPGRWEAEQSWFDPRRHDATFAALPGTPPSPPVTDLRTAFGPPARSYRVGPYTVLVWPHENLLRHLSQVTARTRLWR